MKAIIVARVSTEEQKEANNSLPAQTHRMEDYCQRNNLNIIEQYSFDESAYRDKKKSEFDPIITSIESKNEKIALCFDKVDRLSRDIFDKKIPILYNMALEGKIDIHFVSDNQVLHSKISAGEKFMFGIKLGLSKYYSDAISDNVIRSFGEKRSKGEITGQAMLGYKNITLDDGVTKDVVLDPDRADIVARMFEMYASGEHSMLSILRWANDTIQLRSKKGNKIVKSMVERILHNPFYCGIIYSKKYNTFTPHNYPQLISKEIFDRCQDVCSGNRVKPIKAVSRDFIFKGIFTCEHCGCVISPELHTKPSGKSYTYYSCTNGKHNCKKEFIPESVFMPPLEEILAKLSKITPETQEYILKHLKESAKKKMSFQEMEIQSLRKEKDNLDNQIDALINTLASPNVSSITREKCDKKIQSLNDQISILEQKLSKYSGNTNDYEMGLNTIISLARRAKEIFDSSEVDEKRRFINYLVQNSQVRDRKPLFKLRSPFDTVLKVNESPIWLPG